MDTTDKVLIAILIAVTAILAGTIGHEIGQHGVRKEALLTGHAIYQHDTDGNPKFVWRE